MLPFYLDERMKNFAGEAAVDEESILYAESAARRLLGTTLVVRGRAVILSMLELYYGGAFDEAHDWYRKNFLCMNSKARDWQSVQAERGLKVYLSHNSDNQKNRYRRFDIVIGGEGVPLSLLVRNGIAQDGVSVGSKRGNPNRILEYLSLKTQDHGREIDFSPEKPSDLFISDTRDEFFRINSLSDTDIERKLRYMNGFKGLPGRYKERLWNFSIPGRDVYNIPEIMLKK